MGTKRGLYLLRDGALTKVLDGVFYGITRMDDSLLAFERCGNLGRILQFHLTTDLGIDTARVVRRGLSPGCHQIDLIGDRLFVADAYNNRILAVDPATWRGEAHYPLGRLPSGRGSPNYAHFNSIYRRDGLYYVVCHNESAKTGRLSEILVLSPDFEIVEKIGTTSRSAHNVAVHGGALYHCDSMAGTLKVDGEVVFACEHFTRGLSISDQYLLLGGSDYAARADRTAAPGHLYVLDRGAALVGSFEMPGMVQEVRRLDAPDYGLSAFA